MDNVVSSGSNILWEGLSRFVAEHLGLHFPRERWPDLWQGVASACPDLGFQDTGSCVEHLLASPLSRPQAEILASHLTIGETYFFREPSSFDALETEILPDLIRSRRGGSRSLRIWSAGCATGEEPCSIAIFLHRKFPELRDWRLTILGTDINPRFLGKAAAGVYTEWSFRGTPAWVKNLYFTRRDDGQFELLPQIRNLVTFAYLNLARDFYPSILNNTNAMDIIFCRNVLMYFTPEVAAQVVQRFGLALVEGGWLSLSPHDASYLQSRQFMSARCPGAFHKKHVPGSKRLASPAAARGNGILPRGVSDERGAGGSGAGVSPATEGVPPSNQRGRDTREGRRDACSTTRSEPSSAVPEASRLYQAGRYAEAVNLLTRHLAGSPRDTQALALVARACANQGRLADALAWCEQGLALERLNPSFHLLRATILQEQGRADIAVASLQRVLYLDPRHLLAHFVLGNLFHQQGRAGDAARHFAQALELLKSCGEDEVVPESEGITAGRLQEIIEFTLHAAVTA